MSKIASSVRWATIETAVSRAFSLSAVIYIGRLLGPETMGVVALILISLEVFKVLSDFGVSHALIQYESPSVSQLSTLYIINWITSILIFLLFMVLSPYIAEAFDQPSLSYYLKAMAVVLPINAMGQQIIILLQKELNFKPLTVFKIAGSVVNFLVAILMATYGYGVWSIVVANIAGAFVINGLAISYGLKFHMFSGLQWRPKEAKPLLVFGAYQTGAMTVNMINSRMDQVIIGVMMGSHALGIYSMASRMTLMPMQQVNTIAAKVAFPTISKNKSNSGQVKRIYFKVVNLVFSVNAALLLGLASCGKDVTDILLGKDWASLPVMLALMSIYVLIRSLGNINGPLIMGLGKANWAFFWNLFLMIFIPITLFVASQQHSLMILISALLGIQVVFVSFAYFYWIKRLLGPCLPEYLNIIIRPLICSVLMFLIVRGVSALCHSWSTAWRLPVEVIVGAAAYAALSLIFNGDAVKSVAAILRPRGNSVSAPEEIS